MDFILSSEMYVPAKATRRHILEDGILDGKLQVKILICLPEIVIISVSFLYKSK
jgi:hypothetical protein